MTRLLSIVVTLVSVLALGWPASGAAQMYRPERPEMHAGPGLDFQLNAFSNKRGIDRLPSAAQIHGEWKLYGRLYLVNFQNKLDEPETATRFTWRRSGPRMGNARIYILLHRQF